MIDFFNQHPGKIIIRPGTEGDDAEIKNILRSYHPQNDQILLINGTFRPKHTTVNVLSRVWDLCAEIEDNKSFESIARNLLYVDNDNPCRLLTDSMLLFIDAAKKLWKRGPEFLTLEQLDRVFEDDSVDELRAMLAGTVSGRSLARTSNDTRFDSARWEIQSIIGYLYKSHLKAGDAFSVRRWFEQDSGGVLLIPFQDFPEYAFGFIRSSISIGLHAVKKRQPGSRRFLFAIDGVDTIGQISHFADDLIQAVEAGAHILLRLTSSYEAFERLYGKDADRIREKAEIL